MASIFTRNDSFADLATEMFLVSLKHTSEQASGQNEYVQMMLSPLILSYRSQLM
jgi:hypothetical protein